MTVVIGDAGSGDLLFDAVICAYRLETGEFTYGLVDIKFAQRVGESGESVRNACRLSFRSIG